MKKHEPLTEEQLAAIKARAEAATPGAWGIEHVERRIWAGNERVCFLFGQDRRQNENNGVFIAHAREDVPALLAEVERLRAAVGRLREREEWFITHILEKELFLCPMPEGHKCEQRDGLLCCFDSSEMEIRRRCWRYAADMATRENPGESG